MWDNTDRYLAALAHGHAAISSVQVLAGEDVILDLGPEGVLVGGSVSVSHSDTQRAGSLSMVDLTGELSPREAEDIFAPAGHQIRISRGIHFGAGDEELTPLATMRFTGSTANWPRIELTECYDRSWVVMGALLENPLTVAQGANIVDTMASVLTAAYPGLPINFPTTDETTNSMVFDTESNPWAICQDFAGNLGMRLFMDPMGVATMASEPDASDSPVWFWDDSSRDCMALPGVEVAMTGVGFNVIQVVASNSSLAAPIRSIARDTDPNSPMQYGGLYGIRMAPTIQDEKISTQAQADNRAKQELRNQLGLMQTISIPSMVVPGLDILDPVWVSIARAQQTGTPPIPGQLALVDSVTIPMRAKGGMVVQTRAQRVVSVG